MNLELIEKRRQELNANLAKEEAMRERLMAGLEQNKANIQAIGGALQDLEYWENALSSKADTDKSQTAEKKEPIAKKKQLEKV